MGHEGSNLAPLFYLTFLSERAKLGEASKLGEADKPGEAAAASRRR